MFRVGVKRREKLGLFREVVMFAWREGFKFKGYSIRFEVFFLSLFGCSFRRD